MASKRRLDQPLSADDLELVKTERIRFMANKDGYILAIKGSRQAHGRTPAQALDRLKAKA